MNYNIFNFPCMNFDVVKIFLYSFSNDNMKAVIDRNKVTKQSDYRRNFILFLILINLLFISNFVFSASSGTIDNMDSTTGWILEKDVDTTLTYTVNTDVSTGNKYVYGVYDLTLGNWVQIGKDFSSVDLSQGDGIKFLYKSDVATNIEIKLTDYDSLDSSKCDKFDATITGILPTSDTWKSYIINFSSFTTFPDGLGFFDKNKVTKLYFGVKNITGTGNVSIDEVELYKNISSSGEIKIDDFENVTSNFNLLGHEHETYNSGPQATGSHVIVSTVSYAGSGSLEINFSVNDPTAWTVLADFLADRDSNTIVFDGTNYDTVEFYMKGKTGNENPRFAITWDDGSQFGKSATVILKNYVNISSFTWQKYAIPFSDFPGMIKTRLRKLEFNFSQATMTGTIYVDEIKFKNSAFTGGSSGSGSIKLLDNMDDEIPDTSWQSFSSNAGEKIFLVNGYKGNAINLSYDLLSTTQYAGFERDLRPSVKSGSAFRFLIKGSNSNPVSGKQYKSNNIEFKVSDKDDTTYIKRFYSSTLTEDEWKTFTVPFSELTFFSKSIDGDENLDLRRIKKIWFTAAKNQGGEGDISIDNLEYLKISDLNVSSRNLGFFNYMNVPYNPFSPNGDGSKDNAIFKFSFSEPCNQVNIKILDLSGMIIKEITNDEQKTINTDYEMTWDGRDSDNNIVRNGLYIFKLSAKALDGKENTITNVIGVLK